MNPTHLRASNYRTFRDLDLVLPEGTVGVVGPNGAGKSSIVNAVDLALFGPEGRSWQPYLTVGEEAELMVELTFEHGGHEYRVRRGFSAQGAGKSTLDLEKYEGDVYYPLTLGSAKETQELLDSILGFSRATLRASSLLLQADRGAFTEASPRDRKRILADALGLDRYERLLALARRDRRAAEHELARIDGRLQSVTRESLAEEQARVEDTIRLLAARQEDADTRALAAEHELAGLANRVEQARRVERDRAVLSARRDTAAAALAAKVRVREDADLAQHTLEQVRAELRALPTTEQLAEYEQREQALALQQGAHEQAVREHQDALSLAELRATERRTVEAQAATVDDQVARLDEKIRHLEQGELDSCPTCQQQLGAEARAATIGSLRAEAQSLTEQAQALRERAAAITVPAVPAVPEPDPGLPVALTTVRALLRAAREAEVTRARLTERATTLNTLIDTAATDTFQTELAGLEQELRDADTALAALAAPVDIGPLEAQAVTVRARLDTARAEARSAEADRAAAAERLQQLTARTVQLEQDLADRERYGADLAQLAVLERAYGPDGIPALIVENAAVPSIEVEANRILQQLGSKTAGCRVELRTDRAKKTGGVRDDVLDIIVVTPAGEQDYSTFSEGEKTRLNLALRLALARLLATRRGADVRALIIDEPMFLDADGSEALVELLRDLEAAGVFDRLYLVSHIPGLRDAFDRVFEVVQGEDGRSRVVGAAVPVEAAA